MPAAVVMSAAVLLPVLVLLGLYGHVIADDSSYIVGTGRCDVTGPAAEIEMVSVSFCSDAVSIDYSQF